jgi:hypothetical protein
MLLRVIPRQLPGFNDMLRDLETPDAKVARALGISVRTLARYKARDDAPRAVLIAMYWATRWGREDLNTTLQNEASMYAQYCRCLIDELASVKRELQRALLYGTWDSANAPLRPDFGPLRAHQPPRLRLVSVRF